MTLGCFIVYDGLGVITVNLYNRIQILIFSCSFFLFWEIDANSTLNLYVGPLSPMRNVFSIWVHDHIVQSTVFDPLKGKKKKEKRFFEVTRIFFKSLFFLTKNIYQTEQNYQHPSKNLIRPLLCIFTVLTFTKITRSHTCFIKNPNGNSIST